MTKAKAPDSDYGKEAALSPPAGEGEVTEAMWLKGAAVFTAIYTETHGTYEAIKQAYTAMREIELATSPAPDWAQRAVTEIKSTLRKWPAARNQVLAAIITRYSTPPPRQEVIGVEALEKMRERDDRNGSLPPTYREIIDAALKKAKATRRGE